MGTWKVISGLRRWAHGHPSSLASQEGPPAIGLALGGGFARGVAHIGVLKVLEQNHIRIQAMAGTSVGSIIGASYASGTSLKEMEERAALIRFHDFARWTVSRMGLASNARMEQFLRRCFKKTTFEELDIPLAVTATDINTGEQVSYRSGDLIDPVRASCAYPALFLPVKIGERTLIDGAFSCPVPVAPLIQMGATHIIAVHLVCNPFPSSTPTNLFQMVGHCFSLLQTRAGAEWRKSADCVIQPAVAGHDWDQFEDAPELIAAGEKATRAMLPQIEAWFKPRVSRLFAVRMPA